MRALKKCMQAVLLSLFLCFALLPLTAFADVSSEGDVLQYWSEGSMPPQDSQQAAATPQPTVIPQPTATPQPSAAPQASPQPEPSPSAPQDGAQSQGDDDGFYARDLQYDQDTHKQFITVQGRSGNPFYIVIDYDSPISKEEEQYKTYFLNQVDEADLAALVEQAEPAACSCTKKCQAGAVNTACPVCAANMSECVGIEPEPEPTPEPSASPEPEPEQPEKGVNWLMPILLIVLMAVGGVIYFLKFRQKKPDVKGSDDLDDYDYGDEDDEETDENEKRDDEMDDGEDV